MENYPQERVIFSVDKPHLLNPYQKALRQLDTLRATVMTGTVTTIIGSYERKLEPSFMILATDWDDHVRKGLKEFMKEQKSILRVPGDVRQPCTLEFLDGSDSVVLGPMEQGIGYEGWSYVLETGLFFNCDKGE